jgi:hypothetical protein
LFLGSAAEAIRDWSAAAELYSRAANLHPEWQSARSAGAALRLRAGSALPKTTVAGEAFTGEATDPWYRYSCTVFTPSVASELSRRVARLAVR